MFFPNIACEEGLSFTYFLTKLLLQSRIFRRCLPVLTCLDLQALAKHEAIIVATKCLAQIPLGCSLALPVVAYLPRLAQLPKAFDPGFLVGVDFPRLSRFADLGSTRRYRLGLLDFLLFSLLLSSHPRPPIASADDTTMQPSDSCTEQVQTTNANEQTHTWHNISPTAGPQGSAAARPDSE